MFNKTENPESQRENPQGKSTFFTRSNFKTLNYSKKIRPNIILILTDQQRGDCIEIDGHPVLQTPMLNILARQGTLFKNAYTACPVCIPARRTLMSGQKPSTHGVLHNYGTELRGPYLPQVLRDGGYQTMLSGKLHLWPIRKHFGFERFKLADGPGYSPEEGDSDYLRYLRRNAKGWADEHMDGTRGNSCYVRTWHMEEKYHNANWTTQEAIEFIETLDPTRPFFLNLSYFHPHPPITPPQFYYDRYMSMDMPEPTKSVWSQLFTEPSKGYPHGCLRQKLDPRQMKQYRAAYYAQINHIDDQINRVFHALSNNHIDMNNTLVVFTSDHGEMLGDHQYAGKTVPYQGSVRVPLIVKLPGDTFKEELHTCDATVELMDIMPTILDCAGVGIPDTVEGKSLIPFVEGENPEWREYIHGECSELNSQGTGMQYLTDGKRKYIWLPGAGEEQYFNLEDDPDETNELSQDSSLKDEIQKWRKRLINELKGRPEGFTDGKKLLKLNGPTTKVLPGFERAPGEKGEG